MIRRAQTEDLERLTEIYNQAILSKKATADLVPLTAEQRKNWFQEHCGERTPLYVYEDGGNVAGYCTLSEYRPGRQGLRTVAEVSYYVDFAYHRKGIGSQLLRHAMSEAKKAGYRNLLAILLSCNDGSTGLLEKYGFERWGTLPNIVYMHDHVYSHYYYGIDLGKE